MDYLVLEAEKRTDAGKMTMSYSWDHMIIFLWTIDLNRSHFAPTGDIWQRLETLGCPSGGGDLLASTG